MMQQTLRSGRRWALPGICLGLGLGGPELPLLVRLALVGLGLASLPTSDGLFKAPAARVARYGLLLGCLTSLMLASFRQVPVAERATVKAPLIVTGRPKWTLTDRFAQTSPTNLAQGPKPVRPTQIDGLYGEAEHLVRQGRYAEALERYERAIESDPNEPFHYYQAGLALRYAHEEDTALARLNQGIALAKRAPRHNSQVLSWLYEDRALTRARLGQCQKVKQDLSKACGHGGLSPSECAGRLRIPDCREGGRHPS